MMTDTDTNTSRDVSFDEQVEKRSGISAGAWEHRSTLPELLVRQSKWADLFNSRQPAVSDLAQAA